jgi:MFS family permease
MSNTPQMQAPQATPGEIESRYAWWRLAVSLTLMTIGGSGMYAISVVLPRIQHDFSADRGAASLPYTLTMIGFGIGGVMMGKLADRFGVAVPVVVGGFGLGLGFVLAGLAPNLFVFDVVQGLLIGLLGTSATFAPLAADTSKWFDRRRGIALAICMSGNYVAGAVWPPVIQPLTEAFGWRATFVGIGIFSVLSMLPLALVMRRRPPQPREEAVAASTAASADTSRPMGLSPGFAQFLLCAAAVSCCVAMAMPQVHIVAYCSDLGFGAARGAEMLSLMLGLGVVSRLVSGWVSDRIGGLRTLLAGAILQGIALLLFLPYDGLVSLYVVSGLFGLFQGGLVPSYALIVRQHFPAAQAGWRVGTAMMASLFGMALGGWMSGAVFDWTGSYRAAFVNGIGWNLLNIAIVSFLLWTSTRSTRVGPSAYSSARA